MSSRRPLFFIVIITLSLGVLFEAMIMPDEKKWPNEMFRLSRRVENEHIVDEPSSPAQSVAEQQAHEMSEIRRAAQAQWDLAEWHFARGDWDEAEREYLRYKENYPYVKLDWGYRTDDVSNRLREIAEIRAKERDAPLNLKVPGHDNL